MGLAIAVNTALENIPPNTPVASGKPLYRDSFGGGNTSTLLGRLTDAAPGLVQETWVGTDAALAINAGRIVRGTNTSGSFANLLPTTAENVSIAFDLFARPAVSGIYIDIRRGTITGAPDSYRLEITATTCRIMKRLAGVHSYLSGSLSVPAGCRIVFRKRGTLIEALVNGVQAASATDSDVTTGNYVGIAGTNTVAGFSLGKLAVNTY